MSSVAVNINEKYSSKMNLKQLKVKTNVCLESRSQSQQLFEIIQQFELHVENKLALTPFLLALEQIFTEVLKKREMVPNAKTKLKEADNVNREWLHDQYTNVWKLILNAFEHTNSDEATQALVTAMRLINTETKYPRDPANKSMTLPVHKLNNILQRLLSRTHANGHLFNRFKEYGAYLDVVFYTWKILPGLTAKAGATTDIYIQNFLDLINTVPISAEVQENKNLFCSAEDAFEFDYPAVRKSLNKVWACVLRWELTEATHKQMLIVLLEKVLCHLDKPVLLTDFLMDSLDVGGPISLLALQGVFTLIQQHNLTYPKLYEKLYSMFEPEIFHTKFKARLFYLADIFLSSSHLPENLVAAFAKRLARLSLVAPPQDIITIIYFIGNLILRHPGLKRLIFHPIGGEIPSDPYIMDERDPTKSNALDSSLWEIVSLQQHLIPSVAQAAKIILSPLPKSEWNLSDFLETKENDIFDQEILKRSKECALNLERPQSSNKSDVFSQYWKLF